MFSRQEVKSKGKESFKNYYWYSVLVSLVLSVAAGGSGGGSGARSASNSGDGSGLADSIISNPAIVITVVSGILIAVVIGLILKAIVFNVIIVGCRKYFIGIQNDESSLNSIIYGFKEGRFANITITMLLMEIYKFLWTCLFIIPGIIKAYEYRMIPYILAEDPTIERAEAFRRSKEMMNGNKWAAFVYDLSFIGWIWLSVFTCGILAIFYVGPYKASSDAALYEALKNGGSVDTVSSVEY